MNRVAQAEECDVKWKLRVGSTLACVQHDAAAEIHDHEQFLRGPHAQLAGRDADDARIRRPQLADDLRPPMLADLRELVSEIDLFHASAP